MKKSLRLRIMIAAFVALLAGAVWAGSGFSVSGVDLDSIFAPYHSGWPQASATGYKVAGVDLNARYAPLSTGSAASATGFKVGGTDLSAIFAGAGTTGVQVATQPGSVSGSSAAGNPSGTVTSSTTSAAGAKGSGSYSYTWHIASGSASPTAPSSQTSGVTGTLAAGTTDTGTMYATISDGVSSVNTNTVSWSLQNTTSADYMGTLVAGETSEGGETEVFYGYNNGAPAFGSLTSTIDANGNTIVGAYFLEGEDIGTSFILTFSEDLPSTYFTSLSIYSGATLVATYPASSAMFTGGSGASWKWSSVSNPFVSGDTYTVKIIY